MLTKTNIWSVQNYFRGSIDRQQFDNDKRNVDVALPPGKSFADAHQGWP